jgi:hypothetical protein
MSNKRSLANEPRFYPKHLTPIKSTPGESDLS